MKKIILLTASMLTWSVAWAEPDTYRIDPSHSFANWSPTGASVLSGQLKP